MSRNMQAFKAGVSDGEPINFYYQFKEPAEPHPKVKVMKKGTQLAGSYEHTFVEGKYQTHLIKTDKEGKVTLKGCTSLNKFFATLSKGTYVEVTYKGKGKAKKGSNPPFLFDLQWDTNAPANQAPADPDKADDDEASEELDEEVAF